MLDKITDKNIIAILCNQWGDTGKGKFSDYFASKWADVIVRGTGGNNAGHTVVLNGKKRIFHLLPAGIVYDSLGKINILGNGMVIDLTVLSQELNELDQQNLSYNNLLISEDAHVIMPYQIKRDQSKNSSQKNGGIGSTGRGIGPCYTDKIARRGIMIRDLFNKELLAKKIAKAKEFYPEQTIDAEEIIAYLEPFVQRVKPFAKNTIAEMPKFAQKNKKILIEGAQGLLLSIEYGTYPYVTSSDCSINGTAAGAGIGANNIDVVLGIVKYPFMTRVGAGPFPSELGGIKSEDYCALGLEHDVEYELQKYGVPFDKKDDEIVYNKKHQNIVDLMNSDDDFERGIGIRLAADEYGATTKRPRRIGWTDLTALKYAIGINGPDVILTKADVLQGIKEFKLATEYNCSESFVRCPETLRNCKPSFESFEGFDEDISKISDYEKLPKPLKQSIDFMEKYTGANLRMVSTGPEGSQTIIK